MFREIDGAAASKCAGTEKQLEERGKTSNVEELCKKGKYMGKASRILHASSSADRSGYRSVPQFPPGDNAPIG